MSLVAVGACYVDTILTTPHYPSEDEKLRASTLSRRRGGNCANSLEVLQQLLEHSDIKNLKTASPNINLVAVLPARSSVATHQIREGLEPHVSLEHSIFRELFNEPASSYIIKASDSGSRTIVNYNELPEMTVEEFQVIADSLGPGANWFHFEGRIPDVILDCIKYLRTRFPSVRISVEVEKPRWPGLQELAAEADVVFYSKSWAQGNGYQTAEECLQEQSKCTAKASLLCCTWGQDGATVLETSTSSLIHVPGYTEKDFQVVDPVGAGDTFIAGMLYSLIYRKDDWDLSCKLKFANRVAGMKVGQEGFSGLGKALDRDFR